MGLGSTTKKLQTMAERAEQLYAQIVELREQISELRETVEATGTRVEELDLRSEKQWAIIQAIAEEHDIDVDEILTEEAIDEVEPITPTGEAESDEDGSSDSQSADDER